MADDDKKDPKIEVMPPMRRGGSRDDALPEVTVPSTPLGSTYLGRIKWRATGRLIAAYSEMVREMEGAQRALGDLDRALLDRQEAKMMLADAERIHATAAMQRELAYLKAKDELEEAKFKLKANAHDRAGRERELLQEKEPVEPEKPWQKVASKLQEIMEAEREMRAWFAGVKADEIRKAGGEDKLSGVRVPRGEPKTPLHRAVPEHQQSAHGVSRLADNPADHRPAGAGDRFPEVHGRRRDRAHQPGTQQRPLDR